MYQSLHIQNFRLFEDLKLNDIGRINVIGGRNNTGKTALLEAIFMLSSGNRPQNRLVLANNRGIENLQVQTATELWAYLFNNFQTHHAITLSGVFANENVRLQIKSDEKSQSEFAISFPAAVADSSSSPERSISYQFEHSTALNISKATAHLNPQNGNLIVENDSEPYSLGMTVLTFSRIRQSFNELAERYSVVNRHKQKQDLIDVMRFIEPQVQDLTLNYEGKKPIFYVDMGWDSLVPLALMGDGLIRLFAIVLTMTWIDPKGVVLFDEIESGIHFSAMSQMWQAINELSKRRSLQIFATTHSEECIRAAQSVFADADEQTFRYHRLDRLKTGTIEAVTYSPEALAGATEFDIEVR